MKRTNNRIWTRTLTLLLALLMIVAAMPGITVSAAVRSADRWNGIADDEILIKDTITAISADVTQHEVITNVASGDQQRIDYIAEIKLSENTYLEAGYGEWDASEWSLTATTKQAAAYEEAHPGKTVVAAINADFFNMGTGEPLGALVMEGTEYHAANGRHYFGVTKSGQPVIRDSADLSDLQMAVGGDTLLVDNGQVVVGSFAYGDLQYSRTCIGIKADNTIVTLVTYGLRAPISCGRTYEEIAQMLKNAGCVKALALDGGGSATYCARPEGSDKLVVSNSPADGAEREVSSSLLVVSSAEATGVFDHVVLSPNNELYTPGTEVAFEAKAVDTAGMPMDMPAGLTWALAGESVDMGTMDAATGVFTAAEDATGTVIVNMMQGETVVGSTTIELVTPDRIYFASEEISLGFEDTTDFGIVVRNQGRDINFKAGDLVWSTTNDQLGTFDGNVFTSSDGASLNGNITAASKWDDTVKGTIHVIVGMLPTVVWDFEDRTLDDGTTVDAQQFYIDGYTAADGSAVSAQLTHSNYGRGGQESIEIVSIDDDEPVRFGSKSLKLNYDFINCGAVTEGACVGSTERMTVPGVPTGIGVWVYAPEGVGIEWGGEGTTSGFWLRGYVMDGNGSNQPFNYTFEPKSLPEGEQPGVYWEGWKYLEADLTALAAPYGIQAGMTFRLMYVAGTQMGTKSAGSIYFDNLQFVYGTNIDDVDAPVVDSITVNGQELENGTEFTADTLDITAMFHDVKNKYTSGIDAGTVRMYIDGVNVVDNDKYQYSLQPDGTMAYLYDLKLDDGAHTITVSLRDGFGNDVSESRQFSIKTGNKAETKVEVKALEDAAILGKTVTLAIQANSDNVTKSTTQFRLGNLFPDYEVKFHENFDGTYSYSKSTGLLTVTATRKETAVNAITEEEPTYNIAELVVQVPTTLNSSASFIYEVKGGSFTTATGFYATYYIPEASLPVAAAYRISADPIIVDNKTAVITVCDNTGKPAAGVTLYMAADNSEIGKTLEDGTLETDKFSAAAGVYQIYAKDDEGMISFLYNVSSYDAAGSEDGLPYDIRYNHTSDSSTTKSISWLSGPLTEGKQSIQYAVSGGSDWTTLEANSQLKTFTAGGNLSAVVNSITLTGLTPATSYTFKVGSGEAWTQEYSFTTASDSDSTKFFLLGDIQADDMTNITSVIDILSTDNYDFGIQTGDAVDNATSYADWREIMDLFNQSKFGNANLVQVLGNHEYEGDTAGETAKVMYNLPDGSMGSHYSFTSGNVYVAVINYTANSSQLRPALEWLKADAQASDADWKILAIHQPPYYTNVTGGNSEINALVPKAAEEAGIDVVFSGHDHSLVRTNPLTGGEIDEDNGILYYICGSSGEKSYSITSQGTFNYDKVFALATLDFTATYLTAESTKHTLTININDLNRGLMNTYTLKSACLRDGHANEYDPSEKKVICSACGEETADFTGEIFDAEENEYYMLNGEIQTEWVTVGEEMRYYNPETAIREEVTIQDTPSTCIIDGHCIYTAASGAEKRVDYNDAGGHDYVEQWDKSFKCSKCQHVRVEMEDCTVTLTYDVCTYTGNARTPATKAVAPNGAVLTKRPSEYPDYYSTYKNNVEVGTASVTLTASRYGYYVNMNEWRGNAKGSVTVTYEIRPDLPSNVRISVDGDTATLKWDASKAADSYIVLRSLDGETWEEMDKVTGCEYAVAANVSCAYRIRSAKTVQEENGEKTYYSINDTASVYASPMVEVDINEETGKPTLTWETMRAVEAYHVYRSTNAETGFEKIFETKGRTYTHVSATVDRVYYYKVKAVYTDGTESMFSQTLSATALCAAPVPELKLDDNGIPTLSWEAVDGAAAYIVTRKTGDSGEFETLTTTAATSYLDDDVKDGGKYTYRVTSVSKKEITGLTSDEVVLEYSSIRPEPVASNRFVDGQPTLKWDAVDGAESYEVYRSTAENGKYVKVYTTTGTTYTHISAEFGITYYYKVKAIDAEGKSVFSQVVSATPVVPGFRIESINREDGKPRLLWTKAEGAKSYQVYRSDSADGEYVRVFTTTGTSYTNTSAKIGETYFYKIKVVYEDGITVFSGTITGTCRDLEITVETGNRAEDGKPTLRWNDIPYVRYEVYRANSISGKYTRVFKTTGSTYTHVSAEVGKTYYYKVKAVLVDGSEVDSVIVTNQCVIQAPVVETGNRASDGKPTLSWNAIAGASYEVYRSTNPNGGFTKVFSTDGTTYTHVSAVEGKTYYYLVKAVVDGGESEFSDMVSNSVLVLAVKDVENDVESKTAEIAPDLAEEEKEIETNLENEEVTGDYTGEESEEAAVTTVETEIEPQSELEPESESEPDGQSLPETETEIETETETESEG